MLNKRNFVSEQMTCMLNLISRLWLKRNSFFGSLILARISISGAKNTRARITSILNHITHIFHYAAFQSHFWFQLKLAHFLIQFILVHVWVCVCSCVFWLKLLLCAYVRFMWGLARWSCFNGFISMKLHICNFFFYIFILLSSI